MTFNKNLFGIAAVIMALGFFVRSFQQAHAVSGPSVSLGSNPIKSWGYDVTASSNKTVETFTSDFVVTDFSVAPYNSTNCKLALTTQNTGVLAVGAASAQTGNYVANLRSGIKIATGETLIAQITQYSTGSSRSCSVTISGYYSH